MYQWRQLRHGTLKPSPWTGGKVETRQRERAPRQDSRPGIALSSSSLAEKHAYKQDFFPLRLDESLWRVGRRWTARLVRAWLQAKNVHGNSAEISSWLSATYMLQPTHPVTGHKQMSVRNSLCTYNVKSGRQRHDRYQASPAQYDHLGSPRSPLAQTSGCRIRAMHNAHHHGCNAHHQS